APDMVLSSVKIDGTAEFVGRGEHISARRINGTTLPDGTAVTLLRLETSTSASPVEVGTVSLGDQLIAAASGQEWRGSPRAKTASGYSIEPDFSLGGGTAVYRESDRTSLVGFGLRTSPASEIIPAKDVLSRLSVLNAGH